MCACSCQLKWENVDMKQQATEVDNGKDARTQLRPEDDDTQAHKTTMTDTSDGNNTAAKNTDDTIGDS